MKILFLRLKRVWSILVIILLGFTSAFADNASSSANPEYVISQRETSAFTIIDKGVPAPIVVNAYDYQGVIRAAEYFKNDLGMVAGKESKLVLDVIPVVKQVIIVGTLGKSPLIDQLIKTGKIDVNDIRGRWENSLIQVVDNPFPDVERALVIVGSDKRGTMYGMFDVSSKMGVSPWYWWADVPVAKKSSLYVKSGRYNLGEPKVKYRGIFLNDEEPGLGRWAVYTYGGFNHMFYEKVFELILRLKGNYIWPAMWWASFNTDDPQNITLADEMGIVTGTSHHEPMNRAHAEWKKEGKGAWNYETNSEVLKQFWTDGVKRIGDREVIINMAMRGDGDMAMSAETNISLLENIVADQRKIIADITGKDPSQTPQMWALYKEVQDYYDQGMRVPDDITLMLCDDNWGNIRKLPKPGTPPRKGGYAIYYHIDYVGGPRNYKWLNTSPIPRIWEQMNLAYEHGVDRLWLVNVGDLKPMELPISFFLDYAWNPDLWPAEKLPEYTKKWAEQQFGDKNNEEIAELLDLYTKYNGRRKPELLEPGTYSLVNFREAESIVADYNSLLERVKKVEKKLPKEYNDAFYQLVKHPIEACATLNELYVTVAKNRLYIEQWRSEANDLAKKAKELYKKDSLITVYYHNELSNGKWLNMMNQTHIGYTYWQQPEKNSMPEVNTLTLTKESLLGVSVEGSSLYYPSYNGDLPLPVFDPINKQSYYVDLFQRGDKQIAFEVTKGADWIKVSESKGKFTDSKRLFVEIDWAKAPQGENTSLISIIQPEGATVNVKVQILNLGEDQKKIAKGYIANNDYIAIEAAHFSRNISGNSTSWKEIPGMGRTLSAMHPVPVNSLRQTPKSGGPVLEYDFNIFKEGDYNINLLLSPTLNIYNDEGLEVAVSIDDQEPKILNMHEGRSFQDWEESVRNNTTVVSSKHTISLPGNHTLKVWMVDPGIVLEKVLIYSGEAKKSYLGGPESLKK